MFMVIALTSLRSRPIHLAVADTEELSNLLTLLESSKEVKFYKIMLGDLRIHSLRSFFGWGEEEFKKFLKTGNFFQAEVNALEEAGMIDSVLKEYPKN